MDDLADAIEQSQEEKMQISQANDNEKKAENAGEVSQTSHGKEKGSVADPEDTKQRSAKKTTAGKSLLESNEDDNQEEKR